MKDKKYPIFLILAITILFSVFSIVIYYNKKVPKTPKNNTIESKEQNNNSNASKEEAPIQTFASIINEPSKDNLQNQFGNSSSNLAQGGFFAGDDNFIYFSLANADKVGLYSSRPNFTTAFRKLSDHSLLYLNIVNNHIYYLNDGLIMYSRKDGTEEKQIYSMRCHFLFAYMGRLYTQTPSNGLVSLNLEGKDEQVIMKLNYDSYISFLYAKDDNLYFTNREVNDGQDYSVISSYNIKSKKVTKLHSYIDAFMGPMQMDGDYIYFLKSNGSNTQEDPRKDPKLLRLNMENSKLETVIEKLPLEFTSFAVKDDILYYTTYSEVYKYFINENRTILLYKNKEIKDLHFSSIYPLKDRLYIISDLSFSAEHLYLFTLKTNGSDVVIVE